MDPAWRTASSFPQMSVPTADEGSIKSGAVLVPGEGARGTVEVRLRLSLLTVQSGALRKNHTVEIRHLVGPIRDAGSAGHRESVSAGLRR